jgi:Family of unknown function (DUF5895)
MSITLEELQGDEFQGEIKNLPIAILLNDKSPSDCGIFIKQSAVIKAGWKVLPTKWHEHIFGTGEAENGLLFKEVNLVIINTSPRFVEARARVENKTSIIGTLDNPVIQAQWSNDKSLYTLRTIYLVLMLDKDGQPLHEVPIALSVKGVGAADLGSKYESFKTDLEKSFAVATGAVYTVKSDKFHSLGVFTPTFAPELVGKEQKSWVATVKSYKSPEAKEIGSYLKFDLAEYIWQIRNATTNFSDKYFQEEKEFFDVVPTLAPAASTLRVLPGVDFDSTEE